MTNDNQNRLNVNRGLKSGRGGRGLPLAFIYIFLRSLVQPGAWCL